MGNMAIHVVLDTGQDPEDLFCEDLWSLSISATNYLIAFC